MLRTWPWVSTFPLNSNNYESLGLYFKNLFKNEKGLSFTKYKTLQKASLDLFNVVKKANQSFTVVFALGKAGGRGAEGERVTHNQLQHFGLRLKWNIAGYLRWPRALCHSNYFKTNVFAQTRSCGTSAGPLLVPHSIKRMQTRHSGGPVAPCLISSLNREALGAGALLSPAVRRPEHTARPKVARCPVPVPGWRMAAL